MTKGDLVHVIVEHSRLSRRHAELIVETLFSSIIETLGKQEKIELRGFGSFRTSRRGARTARNPKTGARVEVPAKIVPCFSPGKDLKDRLNTRTSGQE